jgi:hypothetical protein
MVQQMESKNKPNKISASYIHHETYNLPACYHQQYANTGSKRSKIVGLLRRPKTDMEEICQNNAPEVDLKTAIMHWLLGYKSKLSIQKQTSTTQVYNKTQMDVQYTAMGQYKTIKHKTNLKTPIQSVAFSNHRTLVCHQLYSPQ